MSCPTNNPKRPATVPTHILEVANLTFDTASPYTRPRTPYRQLERTPLAGTRSYVRALVAQPRSSVRPLRATCGTPPDAGWRRHNDCAQDGRQTQSTRRTGAPKRSVTNNDTASGTRAHEHTPLRDDVDGVGLKLGGRWPARKSSLELEERAPHSCTCHLTGRGGRGLYIQ